MHKKSVVSENLPMLNTIEIFNVDHLRNLMHCHVIHVTFSCLNYPDSRANLLALACFI